MKGPEGQKDKVTQELGTAWNSRLKQEWGQCHQCSWMLCCSAHPQPLLSLLKPVPWLRPPLLLGCSSPHSLDATAATTGDATDSRGAWLLSLLPPAIHQDFPLAEPLQKPVGRGIWAVRFADSAPWDTAGTEPRANRQVISNAALNMSPGSFPSTHTSPHLQCSYLSFYLTLLSSACQNSQRRCHFFQETFFNSQPRLSSVWGYHSTLYHPSLNIYNLVVTGCLLLCSLTKLCSSEG